jgi:ubiquinone biosynthesis protein COQ4
MQLKLKERLQSLKMVLHMLADHQFRSLMDEGLRPASIHLDQLQQLPEGSLDRVYADQLIRLSRDHS